MDYKEGVDYMGNAYTISMHQENAGKGKVHQGHNRRDEKAIANQDHIDRNGHHETWIDENIKDFYHKTFDGAVEEFNARQKNKERCITDYYSHIAKGANKQQVAYEAILQVGDKDWHPEDKICRDIFKEYIDTWNDRNPNLKLVGAYYHADEATPHIHVDYVPVCVSNRGMRIQNGLNSALKQQGVVQGPQHKFMGAAWWEQECNCLEDICKSRGLEIERGVTEKGRKHKEQAVFKLEQQSKDLATMLERDMQATIDTKQECEQAKMELEAVNADIERKKRKLDKMGKFWTGRKKDKIEVNRDEWERVLEYTNNSTEIDNRQAIKDAEQMAKDKDLAQRQAQLNAQEAQIEADRRNFEELVKRQANELTADYRKQIKALQEREAQKQATIQQINEFLKQPIYLENYELFNVQCSVSLKVGDLAREWSNNHTAPINALESLVDAQKRNNDERVVNILNRAYEEPEQEQQRCSYRSRDDDWER